MSTPQSRRRYSHEAGSRRGALCFLTMVVAVFAAPFIGSTPIRARHACSVDRCRSRRTSTRRSSSSRGCLARWRRRWSAARSLPRASCFRDCCAIRSRRPTRSASRPVRRSARWSPSRSGRLGGRRRRLASLPARFGGPRRVSLATAQHRGISTTVLLLAGVTLNAFFSALILFVQYLSDFAQTFRALRWLMGDLDIVGYAPFLAALPLIVAFAGFAVAGAAAQSAEPQRGSGGLARR